MGEKPWINKYQDIEARRSSRRFTRKLRHFRFDPQATILDLCCGDGKYLKLFRQMGCRSLVGCDLSRDLLTDVRWAPVAQMDAFALAFRTSSLDVVFVNDALHHFHDLHGLLTEAYRVLRPGGTFFCIEPAPTWARGLAHWALFSPISRIWTKARTMRALLEDEWDTYSSWLRRWPERMAHIEAAGFTRRRLVTDWLYCYGEFRRDGGKL